MHAREIFHRKRLQRECVNNIEFPLPQKKRVERKPDESCAASAKRQKTGNFTGGCACSAQSRGFLSLPEGRRYVLPTPLFFLPPLINETREREKDAAKGLSRVRHKDA